VPLRRFAVMPLCRYAAVPLCRYYYCQIVNRFALAGILLQKKYQIKNL
jgi:hypothetical protein